MYGTQKSNILSPRQKNTTSTHRGLKFEHSKSCNKSSLQTISLPSTSTKFSIESIVSGTSPFFCNPLGKCLEHQQPTNFQKKNHPVFKPFLAFLFAGLLSKFTWLPAAAWSLLPASLRPSPRPCATVPWYRVL